MTDDELKAGILESFPSACPATVSLLTASYHKDPEGSPTTCIGLFWIQEKQDALNN